MLALESVAEELGESGWSSGSVVAGVSGHVGGRTLVVLLVTDTPID